MIEISNIKHPLYTEEYMDFFKYRLTYLSGRLFIDTYLNKFSKNETDDDFKIRRMNTFCPAFAKAEVKNIIAKIRRAMTNVRRVGGTPSYKLACDGGQLGVDLQGTTMTNFIGHRILPELCVMRKVGVYVDMPKIDTGDTLAETFKHKPYLYLYTTEDIRNWSTDQSDNPGEFSSLLLRETRHNFDKVTRLPTTDFTIYKHFYLEDGRVYVQHYSETSAPLDEHGEKQRDAQPLALSISRIPFVIFELPTSLLTDAAQYQIGLLNMASADLNYAIRCNFPFYVEQYDRLNEMVFNQDKGAPNKQDINLGVTGGRRYPKGTEQPAFIAPPSSTLEASMKKQEQMKTEIRTLMNYAVMELGGHPSEEDSENIAAGLNFIGSMLEKGENQIGQIWSMYENSKEEPTITYPKKYRLQSAEQERKTIESLEKRIPHIPSKTYQRELTKQLAEELLQNRITVDVMDKIKKEIDESTIPYIPPDIIVRDMEQGLVGVDTASKLRGYPPAEVQKAKDDHADKLARIAQTQGLNPNDKNPSSNTDKRPSARGVDEQDGETDAGSEEKKGKEKRGKAK